MTEPRIERFKVEAEELDQSATDNGGGRDRLLIAAGFVMMLVGPVVGILCYFSAINADFAEDQNELIILTMAGLGVSLLGLGVFVRYTLGRFLRFFLLRQLYEARLQTEELTAALRGEG